MEGKSQQGAAAASGMSVADGADVADRQAAVGEEGQAVVANPTGPVRRGVGYENVSHIGHTIPWSCMRMSSTRCCSASSARALWSTRCFRSVSMRTTMG